MSLRLPKRSAIVGSLRMSATVKECGSENKTAAAPIQITESNSQSLINPRRQFIGDTLFLSRRRVLRSNATTARIEAASGAPHFRPPWFTLDPGDTCRSRAGWSHVGLGNVNFPAPRSAESERRFRYLPGG